MLERPVQAAAEFVVPAAQDKALRLVGPFQVLGIFGLLISFFKAQHQPGIVIVVFVIAARTGAVGIEARVWPDGVPVILLQPVGKRVQNGTVLGGVVVHGVHQSAYLDAIFPHKRIRQAAGLIWELAMIAAGFGLVEMRLDIVHLRFGLLAIAFGVCQCRERRADKQSQQKQTNGNL